jgi:hypothetical protein
VSDDDPQYRDYVDNSQEHNYYGAIGMWLFGIAFLAAATVLGVAYKPVPEPVTMSEFVCGGFRFRATVAEFTQAMSLKLQERCVCETNGTCRMVAASDAPR